MTNELDPCLIFLPGDVPEDFGRINGGSVDVPDDDGGDIIIRRYRYPNVPNVPGGGIPPFPGIPTNEPRNPPGPRPPEPIVWVCVDGVVFPIRLSEALTLGISWYTTKALAMAVCADPPTTLVWVCRNGQPVQIPLNQIIPNEPFFADPISAGNYCIDPQTFLVWVCRNGVVQRLPWVYLAPNESWYSSYAQAAAGCVEPTEPTTVTEIGTVDPQTPNESGGDTGGGITRTRVITVGSVTPEDYQYGPETTSIDPQILLDDGYYPRDYGNTNNLNLSNQAGIPLLNTQVDSSITTLLNPSKINISELNESLYRVVSPLIRQSIKNELSQILYNLYYPDGRRIPDNKIDKSLQIRALNGTLSKVQVRYVLAIAIRSALQSTSTVVRNSARVLTSTFGNTRDNILRSRLYAIKQLNTARSSVEVLSSNENRAISRAYNNLISLYPESYSGAKKELLKLWYVLPEDIFARVTLETSAGTSSILKVPNTELIPVTASDGSITKLPVTQYRYDISVSTSAGPDLVRTRSELKRAYTLNNAEEMACLFDCKDLYRTTFTVSSVASANLELNYDYTQSLPNYYVFKIDKTSIQDVANDVSPFIRKTKANYTIVTDPEEIENAVKFRLYPWKVFPVEYNDPILGHFDQSSIYNFEYTSFGFEEFGNDVGGPILVRRIPNIVIVVPTDRYDYNFYGGQSTLQDWNIRSLNFTLSPDPEYYNRNLRNHYFASAGLAYPQTDVLNQISESGYRASFVSSAPGITDGYTSQTPQRSQHGFRAAVNIASALNNYYITNNGLSWTDVFTRMTRSEYATYKIGISDKMIDKLRLGEKTGIKLYHPRGGNSATQTRLVELKSGKTDDTTVNLDIQYASNSNN